MKVKSLLGGTIVLITANIISKILGAVLKIPLTYILKEEGMAIYHTTFSVYITVLFLITSGIPFAVSKYISQAVALNKTDNIKKTVNISILIMSTIGLMGSLLLFFGADFFALSMKDPKATASIKAISPSVILVSIGCIYKSAFEAQQNMLPTAISQVVESIVKLILGFSLAMFFASFSVTYATSGAIFSITIGEFIATAILAMLYYKNHTEHENEPASDKYKTIVASIMSVAVPLMITSLVSSCLSLIETSVIRNSLLDIEFTKSSAEKFVSLYSPYTKVFDSLLDTLKMDIDGARWIFGAYTGYAATVFNLPIGMLASLGVATIPAITKSIVLKDYTNLNQLFNTVIKFILLLSIPCSIIIYIFPEEILYILFKNTASSHILKITAPLVLIFPISNILSLTLYSSGNILLPFYNEIIASIIKICLAFILIQIPEINISGVVLSTIVSNVVLLLLNIRTAKKHLHLKLLHISFIIRSIMCSFGMLTICVILKSLLKSNLYTFVCMCCASLLVYFTLVLLSDALNKNDLQSLNMQTI